MQIPKVNSFNYNYQPLQKRSILKLCQNDSFSPSFEGRSLKAQRAISYINAERLKRPVENIYQLDVSKLDGILDGIELFKGIKTEDLYLLGGTIDILTQRGCSNTCLHCFIKARNKFTSMKWDDFARFTEGMKELKERLGFHIFEIKREKYDINRRDYTLSQGLYPYLDADPIEINSLDKNGKTHTISDFVKKFYNDMNAPLKVKTVGWDSDNKTSQKAAEDLVKLLTDEKYKYACPYVIVSMHPFHKIMTRANQALKKGDEAKYLRYRNEYIDRMSNVLKTFLPLAGCGKLLINPQYAVGALEGSGYTKRDLKALCYDILSKLEQDCKNEGIDSSIITAEKDIEKNAVFEPVNQILSVARAKKEFLNDMSANTYSFEKDENGNRNIVVSPFDIKHAFGNEVSENIVNNLKHQKDFIDNVVIDIDPANDSDLFVARENKLSNHRADMFMEKIIHTLKRFEGIDNLIVRLSYQEDGMYDREALGKILSEAEEKSQKKLKNIEYKPSQILHKDSRAAFLEIIDNLNPEGKVRFLSQLRKGINVDGQVYIPVINTRSFGEDFFENRALILNNVKFNYSNPQKYIFDRNIHRIDFDRDEVKKLQE